MELFSRILLKLNKVMVKSTIFSTKAKIGKILILIGIIFGAISMIPIFLLSFSGGSYSYFFIELSRVPAIIFCIIELIGILIGIYAYNSTLVRDFRKASILAIISSFLPPMNIFMLLGGILFLASEEFKL